MSGNPQRLWGIKPDDLEIFGSYYDLSQMNLCDSHVFSHEKSNVNLYFDKNIAKYVLNYVPN